MTNDDRINLAEMRAGHSGVVVQIQGGFGMISRLNGLGIIPGKRIAKIGSMMGQGPVTIEVDRVQVAIGFGMANRIMVKLDQVS